MTKVKEVFAFVLLIVLIVGLFLSVITIKKQILDRYHDKENVVSNDIYDSDQRA